MTTIREQVAEKVNYLKSVASAEGYNIPMILRNEARQLRRRKGAHYHERADELEAAAHRFEVESA